MRLQASFQVYRSFFRPALEYHVVSTVGKVRPDEWLADEWNKTAH